MRLSDALLFLVMLLLVTLVTFSRPGTAQKAPDTSAVDSLYKRGLQSLQQGNIEAARADFEKVVRLAPNVPEGHNSLGWVLMSTGKLDEAIPQFRTALKLNPNFLPAHINLANALLANREKA